MRCAYTTALGSFALVLASAACAGSPPTGSREAAISTPVAVPSLHAPTPPSIRRSADAWRMVELTLTTAAAFVEQPRSGLEVEYVEPRDWPDTSLGCPEQGASYDYILTPGYVVVITTRDQQLEYHTDTRTTLVLCRAD